MRRVELGVRVMIGALLVTAAALPLWTRSHTPLIHAHMAENGGWTPDHLKAIAGKPLHLQLTSDDVTHGFTVGQMDMQSVDVEPGKVADVTLLFKKTGSYTFYCTRWCGINHWRMRGTIEVSGAETAPEAAQPPLYVKLGIGLDAPHQAAGVPGSQPSAVSHQTENGGFSISEFTNVDFYRSHSPYEAWLELRGNKALAALDDQQIWNMVAFIWQSNTNAEDLVEGKKLFAQNCAACHGEAGGGNGVFADKLAATGTGAGTNMMVQRPADFTDASRILGASPALLQGKILRGGMGTGMPAWGHIFTEEQTWKLVAAIYAFQFQQAP
jgi:plastocyanin